MVLHISLHGLELIKSCESFRNKLYICPAGIPTIGFGHVVRASEAFTKITMREAEELLCDDVVRFENGVNDLINTPLRQSQFDALVSFTFNVGCAALQRSTLRQKINRLEFDEVPQELLKWVYVRGIKLQGLVRRRTLEAKLFVQDN